MTSTTSTTIDDEIKETMNNDVLPNIISSSTTANIHIGTSNEVFSSSNHNDDQDNHNNSNSNDETILKKNEGSDNNTNFIQIDGIKFVDYQDESQLDHVMSLVGRDLSEPYSIFTYRYFLYRFPQLCILAIDIETNEPIGCVVGKIDPEEVINQNNNNNNITTNSNDNNHHPSSSTSMTGPNNTDNNNSNTITAESTSTITYVGYIGMLAVSEKYRRRGIGKALVQRILHRFKYMDSTTNNTHSMMKCTSVILETEVTNHTAQLLYQNYFGFIREELLVRYYLNWNDAYRLRLWF